MTQTVDDLEAVKAIIKILDLFEQKDKERIIRWVLEKLGQTTTPIIQTPVATQLQVDIKGFILAKNPQSENHLAATVAYYYKFVAPLEKRKESINKDDILEACRLANINRPKNPDQTLRNAHAVGLLDRSDKGIFSINTVGENLVAMTLPGTPSKNLKKKTMQVKRKETRKKGIK